jgi:NDMA-dependent alcohol dehydrogenase
MRTRAAVLHEIGKPWSVEEIELDPPKRGEVLVRLVAAGLCRSDDHVMTGELPNRLPVIGGHEGAGIVEHVGEGVEDLRAGDHVVFSFIPSCGRCPSCVSGHSNLCDLGAYIGDGLQVSDHTARHHLQGEDLALMCLVGSFAEHTVVNEASCIKLPPEVPLDLACLLGCGVVTGWGSVVYASGIRPGDDVVIAGIGGIGINAVQGAVSAGARRIFAIDPLPFKRQQALAFGATHVAADFEEAAEQVRDETEGRMANAVIMCLSTGRGDLMAAALGLTAKRGRVVITNIHPVAESQVAMSAWDLGLMEKQIVGSLFGSANPRVDILRLWNLHQAGRLRLEELITRRYRLDDVNLGYEDLREGRNLRGIIEFG